jgi:Protein of unknown function (DUF4236)
MTTVTVRKTWNFGPFRFNVTKTGVSASFGFGGFRFGYAIRSGLYVHFSRGGLQYRKYLFSGRKEQVDD